VRTGHLWTSMLLLKAEKGHNHPPPPGRPGHRYPAACWRLSKKNLGFTSATLQHLIASEAMADPACRSIHTYAVLFYSYDCIFEVQPHLPGCRRPHPP
jgi:hypothetical protein